MKKMLMIALLVVASLLLTACGQTDKSAAPAENAKTAAAELSFSVNDTNTVLVDQDGVKVTYVGMEKNDLNYTLKLAYENTTDKSYDVQLRNSKVDGKEELTVCSDTLDAGSTSEGAIYLPVSQLEKAGISEPAMLEADLVVLYDIMEEVAKVPFKVALK